MITHKYFTCFILIILIITTGIGCVKKTETINNKDKTLLVNIDKVETKEIQEKIEVPASIYPFEEVTISNKKEGKVTGLYVDMGDHVTKGKLLAQIDPTDFIYAYDESQARLKSAETTLEGINTSIKSMQEHSLVRQAKANMDDAKSKMERLQKLLDEKLVPQQDYDSAKAAYIASLAVYDNTITSLSKVEEELNAYKATRSITAKGVSDTKIIAPQDGYIQNRSISLGEYLKLGTPMFTIVQTNPLKLKASIPEKYSPEIKRGQKAYYKVSSNPDKTFVAVVSRIAPAIDMKTRTFEIELLSQNNNNQLKPGLFAKLEIDLGKTRQALFVPESAVYTIVGVNKVFTVKNNIAKEHMVKLGKQIDGKVEIINNLDPNDYVITTDTDQLTDGQIIKVSSLKEANKE